MNDALVPALTIELRLLAYSVVLLIVVVLIQVLAGVRAQGLPAMSGSRDNLPAPKVFQARVNRLVDNHREGLIMFAPLVLIAAIAPVSNDWTVLGARLFFYSRVAHALVYLAGWPWVRGALWGVGMLGIFMILFALFGVLT